MKLNKVEVARRQLGTALHLFIEDADPVSVHALACAGMEIAEGLAGERDIRPFAQIAKDAEPKLTDEMYRRARTESWNAFKHFDRFGKPRKDEEIYAAFDDTQNEFALFIGWYDLMRILGRMPVEAQTFQMWFFCRHPRMIHPDRRTAWQSTYFPDILSMSAQLHKAELRKAIRKASRLKWIMDSHLTERRKLLLPNNLAEYDRAPTAPEP